MNAILCTVYIYVYVHVNILQSELLLQAGLWEWALELLSLLELMQMRESIILPNVAPCRRVRLCISRCEFRSWVPGFPFKVFGRGFMRFATEYVLQTCVAGVRILFRRCSQSGCKRRRFRRFLEFEVAYSSAMSVCQKACGMQGVGPS